MHDAAKPLTRSVDNRGEVHFFGHEHVGATIAWQLLGRLKADKATRQQVRKIDPRNLGAIIRSVSAFSGNAVIVPERRSVGVTASAWKTSAGAAARVPVTKAANLNRTLEELKAMGYFVVGLDGGGAGRGAQHPPALRRASRLSSMRER